MTDRSQQYTITASDRKKAAVIVARASIFDPSFIKIIAFTALALLASIAAFRLPSNPHVIIQYLYDNIGYYLLFLVIIVALERILKFNRYKEQLEKYFATVPNKDAIHFAWDENDFWEIETPSKKTSFSVHAVHLMTPFYQFLRDKNDHILWMPTRDFDQRKLADITRIVEQNVPKASFWRQF
jgi:hypothetical protein